MEAVIHVRPATYPTGYQQKVYPWCKTILLIGY
jgi:hypothetical protein